MMKLKMILNNLLTENYINLIYYFYYIIQFMYLEFILLYEFKQNKKGMEDK